MRILSRELSLSRQVLPAVAVIGLVLAVVFIVTTRPDRSLHEAAERPAHATGALADAPRVAGAGVVEPSSEIIEIGTALSGLVASLRVGPGDYVSRGRVLFTVDDRAARARLAEADAAIGEARAAVAEAGNASATAHRQLDLYTSVSDPAAVSRAESIAAEGDARAAELRLRQARARLDAALAARQSAKTDLDRLTVRAPMNGEILAVNIRPGEYVQAGGPQGGGGQPYLTMGETRPLYVRVDVDEDEAVRADLGKPATISPRGAADFRVTAAFVRAEPQVVPKRSLTNGAAERVDVRVLQILYRLPEDSDVFRVGQQIDAFIPARAAPADKNGNGE